MIYQFDCFEINAHNKQLRIRDKVVQADERIIGLLIELTVNYPEHCTKSSLLKTLWPDTVVSEWSISKLVSDTRNLLKQYGCENEVIRTHHGRGYSLSSHLGDQLSVLDSDSLSSSTKVKASLFNARKWLMVLAISALFGAGIIHFKAAPPSLKKSEPAHSIGRLLWVDDNPQNNQIEKDYLERKNITVYQVMSTEEALTSLLLYEYDVVISDMGRQTEVLAGLKLLKAMRKNNNQTPFLLYTIVLTHAQQTLLDQYQGQGVAVEPDKLYELVLPYFENQTSNESSKDS